MKQQKYYAVRKGKKPGIYNSWSDAQKQIQGFSNAVFKSFLNLEDAQKFMNLDNLDNDLNDEFIKAYTDGSYRKSDSSYSYGAAIYFENEIIQFSQRFNDKYSKERNVSGELFGAMKVMEYAYKNNIKNIVIHHDYQGVGAWPRREWKTNIELTQKYVTFYDQISQKVNVSFVWVKGHSGDEGNERADQLASNATYNLINERIKK